MCMSSSPAKFSTTKIYVGEATKDDKLVHVIAYQNNAESLSNEPNAMILPFPTSVPMTEDNVIDTSKFKNFLTDITEASKQKGFGRRGKFLSLGAADCYSLAQVFDVGSYTVILATNIDQISEALQRVPQNKRPTLSQDFLTGFGKLYPKQPIAICCWSGSVEAEPLLWWYEPKDKDVLFVPTMDSHDGLAPKLGVKVLVDHNISVGSTLANAFAPTTNQVEYSNHIPDDVKSLLPTNVWGSQIHRFMENGDMFVRTEELRKKTGKKLHVPDLKRGSPNEERSDPMYGWV